MHLLQVEGLGEIRVPHLHDQRSVQVEELIPLPIVAVVRVLGFEVVGEDKVDVGDPLLGANDSNLVLLEEREGAVRVGVRLWVREDRGHVLSGVFEYEIISSRVVVEEGRYLRLRTKGTKEASEGSEANNVSSC